MFAIRAFNLELNSVTTQVTDKKLGMIRLQWWRDAIDDMYEGMYISARISMCLSVCVCLYMFVCVYECVNLCIWVCLYVYMLICVYVYSFLNAPLRVSLYLLFMRVLGYMIDCIPFCVRIYV